MAKNITIIGSSRAVRLSQRIIAPAVGAPLAGGNAPRGALRKVSHKIDVIVALAQAGPGGVTGGQNFPGPAFATFTATVPEGMIDPNADDEGEGQWNADLPGDHREAHRRVGLRRMRPQARRRHG
jgi:hypothetical protein